MVKIIKSSSAEYPKLLFFRELLSRKLYAIIKVSLVFILITLGLGIALTGFFFPIFFMAA